MLCFVFAALIVVLDQFFKRWIMITLELRETGATLIPGILRLTRWENDGAMLNILAGQQWLLAGIAFVAAFVLVMILLRYNEGFWGTLGLSAVLGGTVGNLIDRIFNDGYVIDMFQTLFIRFPIFNIADIFITLGFLTFCIHFIALTFKSGKNEPVSASHDPDDDYDMPEPEYNEPADDYINPSVQIPPVNVQSELPADYFSEFVSSPAPQPVPDPVVIPQKEKDYFALPVLNAPEPDTVPSEPEIIDADIIYPDDLASKLETLGTIEAALEEIDDYSMDDILREYGFEEDDNKS